MTIITKLKINQARLKDPHLAENESVFLLIKLYLEPSLDVMVILTPKCADAVSLEPTRDMWPETITDRLTESDFFLWMP